MNINISSSTVHRRLIAAGLYGRVTVEKPMLRPQEYGEKTEISKAIPRLSNWTMELGTPAWWIEVWTVWI